MPLIHILCNNEALLRAYPTEEAAMAEAVRLQALADVPVPLGAFYHVHGVELSEDAVAVFTLRAGLEATAREAATHGAMLQVREDNERLAARVAELERERDTVNATRLAIAGANDEAVRVDRNELIAERDKALAELAAERENIAHARIRCEEAIANNQDLRRALATMTERAERVEKACRAAGVEVES